jgi:hypothetical protein
MFVIGFSMMGGYFGLLNIVMPIAERLSTNLSALVFCFISIAYAVLAMKLQTRVELFFIRRHVERSPKSSWRVIARNYSKSC